jgi:hypothetical protein
MIAYFPAIIEGEAKKTFWLSHESPLGVHRELRDRAEDADDDGSSLRSSRRRSPTPSPKSRALTPRPSSGNLGRGGSSKGGFESLQRCAREVLCRAQALSEENAHKAKQVGLEVILKKGF